MTQMKTYRSTDRGYFDHGWLQTWHTFNFAEYVAPDRSGFGKLLVLNDDIIQPGKGFGTHPHRDMEIITIVLDGQLAHKDNTGSEGTISPGEVQVMSAGTGIRHSEYNNSSSAEVNLLQIWIKPNQLSVQPRYDQMEYGDLPPNTWKQIITPEDKEGTLRIYQDSYLHLGQFSKDAQVKFEPVNSSSLLFVMILEGALDFRESVMVNRDAFGIGPGGSGKGRAVSDSKLLMIEIPD
jgi:hypothetical protein